MLYIIILKHSPAGVASMGGDDVKCGWVSP